MSQQHSATLASIIEFYFGKRPGEELLRWPPDVLAITGIILKLSGAYIDVVNRWPPDFPSPPVATQKPAWNWWIQEIGSEWKEAIEKRAGVPASIREWWDMVISRAGCELHEVRTSEPLLYALVQLAGVADEACSSIGIPAGVRPEKALETGVPPQKGLEWEASLLLQTQGDEAKPCTLCKHIPASLLAVLPKLHTPNMGITLRSLSHNLALHENVEVTIRWHQINTMLSHTVNILCVPWPLEITPINFCPTSATDIQLLNMRSKVKLFDYNPPKKSGFVERFTDLLRSAINYTGVINGVIFPELALDAEAFDEVRRILDQYAPQCFLIAGVRSHGRNDAYCSIPDVTDKNRLQEVREIQPKHHRWKLDQVQIAQYGLGGRLDSKCTWWESTVIQHRTMNFFSMQPWLTMGVLICEDLARQDPLADLMRSVGPNLVIALLMQQIIKTLEPVAKEIALEVLRKAKSQNAETPIRFPAHVE